MHEKKLIKSVRVLLIVSTYLFHYTYCIQYTIK
jgi:hypothetical protein